MTSSQSEFDNFLRVPLWCHDSSAFDIQLVGGGGDWKPVDDRARRYKPETMHSALRIDEILRFIFEVILNDGKPSLCCAARCCRSWKDPALDYIWRQLPSALPLLSLLPGFSMQNDGNIRLDPTMQNVTFTAFHSYAIRVKHIIHSHRMLVDLTSIPIHLFHQLSNLESARIESGAIGEVALRMSLAPRLRALALRVGYTKSKSTSTTVLGMMSLLKGCSSLEQLYVRGYSSDCLQMPLSSLTTLRALSLHLSSLTGQSFMTASTFPLLVDFDVHADSISYEYLSTAIARTCSASFFPALGNLKIRARPALVALILRQLPRNKLRSLHVDAIGSDPLSVFEGLFKAMTTLPLHQFTLEHAISIDESEDIPADTMDKYFTLDHLRPLSKLPLRRFILDSSFPPDLSDPGIEEMTKWWPLLERLELGAHTALENVETIWKPKNSLASLCTLARGCKHLRSLVITLDANSLPHQVSDHGPAPLGSHPLASLSISSPFRPDVPSLSAMLSRLFPSLVDLMPGFVGEHEDAWAAVQATILNHGRGSS